MDTSSREENGVGARLRAEREKLRLTQADFGNECGVQRRAQAAYESGERSPDARYLEQAARIGVDVAFVITGAVSRNGIDATVGLESLIRAMCEVLEVPGETVETVLARATALSVAELGYRTLVAKANLLANEVVTGSPVLNRQTIDLEIDRDILTDIIYELENEWMRMSRKIHPIDKSHTVVSLYQQFAAAGRVDREILIARAHATRADGDWRKS
ncbi:helix-turn-helix domain-containing protein [Burkholderia sp. LMG 21824]|uniref:helix-turn-helix domain-containing protein n=1 Tax=Burkholderia sp. LMG 21824 TaxID=3158172 RepID=UPI003C2AED78